MSLQQRVEALYKELRLVLYRYLLMLGLPPDSAQDVTQEAFLRLYQSLSKDVGIDNTRAWLLRVAHNIGLNTLLAQSSRNEELDEDCEALAASQNPESQYIHKHRMAHLRKEISRLSRQQRACLELRAQGLRYREIAEVLGISPSATAEFLRRAVERLQKALDD